MECVKNILSNQVKNLSGCLQGYKIVEREKNVHYFSKYTIDMNDLYTIYFFCYHVLKKSYLVLTQSFKYCIKEFIKFNDENNNNNNNNNNGGITEEKQKIIILYSACFYHYYSMYRYKTNNVNFEDFFNNYFLNDICNKKFKFVVKSEQQFRVIVYNFFIIIQNEIKKYNYNHIIKLENYYNPNLINDNDNNDINNSFNNSNNNINSIISSNYIPGRIQYIFHGIQKFFDMVVYEIDNRNNNNNNNNINLISSENENFKNTFTQIQTEKYQNFPIYNPELNNSGIPIETPSISMIDNNNSFNNNNNIIIDNINNNNIINDNINNNNNNNNNVINDMNINNNNNFPQNFNSNLLGTQTFTKRIFSFMVKSNLDNPNQEYIEKLSKIIEEKYLDYNINNSIKSKKTFIGNFLCYIYQFNSDMIKKIDGYENVPDELNLVYIVPAKEMYNNFFEIFFTLSNLSYTKLNTFIDMGKKFGFSYEYSRKFYEFFKTFQILCNQKIDPFPVIKNIFNEFNKIQMKEWDITLQKFKDMKNIYIT